MPSRGLVWLALCLAWLAAPLVARGDKLPATIDSAATDVAPEIDGVIDADEWKAAPVIKFDLEMFRFPTLAAEKSRACELRVMNSANALYVAWRVPDATVNASLSPVDFDLAMLAFCRGKELAAGDDRHAIAPGAYRDKHVTTPGKDADDPQQDGRGAGVHADGAFTLEWAIPLNSGDANDIAVKPGDSLRFNLAYFDAFQFDFKDTQAGAAYGNNLNIAQGWGTLRLASNVRDDGGTAFSGPTWVKPLFDSLADTPAGRMRLVETAVIPGGSPPTVKAVIEYPYLDPQGQPRQGRAKLYLPAAVGASMKRSAEHAAPVKFPLYQNAGYELDDTAAAYHVGRGFVVATPSQLETNPLIRTPQPDVALLHLTRALPFVDDARVVIGGGSAGGYMTLMLAAETFPLAAAAPDVPPVNWGYNAAYFFKQQELAKPAPGSTTSPIPALFVIGPALKTSVNVFGEDYGDATWFAHSPVAHVPTITCPVCVYWSTADMLVPIDQVGQAWVRPFRDGVFPAGFTMSPDKLLTTPEGRTRLTDVLAEDDYEVFLLPEARVKQLVAIQATAGRPELSFSKSRQWSITILDEGRPAPEVNHVKYPVVWSRDGFIDHTIASPIAVDQLTAAKLERLMDRYAGRAWLPNRLHDLDVSEVERADVLRGLRTYMAAGSEHAATFGKLYAALPKERQALEPDVLRGLTGAR